MKKSRLDEEGSIGRWETILFKHLWEVNKRLSTWLTDWQPECRASNEWNFSPYCKNATFCTVNSQAIPPLYDPVINVEGYRGREVHGRREKQGWCGIRKERKTGEIELKHCAIFRNRKKAHVGGKANVFADTKDKCFCRHETEEVKETCTWQKVSGKRKREMCQKGKNSQTFTS